MQNNLTNRGLFLLYKLVRKELDKRGIKFLPINPSDYTFKSKLSLYDIQKVATKICRHYYLWGYTPVVTYERLSSAAGNINLNMDLHIFINLDNSKDYSNEQIISILAHEIAHKFLFVNFIRYEGLKNEFITDATAVCAGFGNIMANSCVSRTKNENSTTIINIGYLTEWQIRYLIDCFCGRITEEPKSKEHEYIKYVEIDDQDNTDIKIKEVHDYYKPTYLEQDDYETLSNLWNFFKSLLEWIKDNPVYSIFIVFIVCFCLVYCTFGIERYDPEAEQEKARLKAERDSIEAESQRSYIYVDDSTKIETKTTITEYHNNQLKNGSHPYKEFFSKPITGRNYMTFVTKEGSDCIVIIKNTGGKYYNHIYIQGGKSATCYLPDGLYNVYFYFGKGWNPNKQKGKFKGGFEENERQSRNDSVVLKDQYYIFQLYSVANGNLSLRTATIQDMFN